MRRKRRVLSTTGVIVVVAGKITILFATLLLAASLIWCLALDTPRQWSPPPGLNVCYTETGLDYTCLWRSILEFLMADMVGILLVILPKYLLLEKNPIHRRSTISEARAEI